MKILLCHNYYQEPGGEDAVFADEAALLTAHGHEVIRYTAHNESIKGMSRWQVARSTLWNHQSYTDLKALFKSQRPAVLHCTNTFPLVSPAAYYAARAAGVPVVQSLHNYRLFCVNGLLMRDGHVCETCVGRATAWPGIAHACYRDSRAASAAVAAMQAVHWTLGTWTKMVDLYVALTEFAREKFIAGGLPAKKLVVKPNFVSPDPGVGDGRGGYAIYVGRLSVEKGIDTLLSAWQKAPAGMKLKIVGDGPSRDLVRAAAEQNAHVEWLGHLPRPCVQTLIAEAAVLVLPSVCYEGLPKTILEAFASGTPVVGARLGGIAAAVKHAETGRLFTPGNAPSLAAEVEHMVANSDQFAAMRRAARREFEANYTAQRNYELLMSIYHRAGVKDATRVPDVVLSSEHPHHRTQCGVAI